jgi:hypothetical protein
LTFDELKLHEEWIGDRYRERQDETGTACDRGLIIRDLAGALREGGLRTGNDGKHDLLVTDRTGRVAAVFAVLTRTELPSLYAGTTELLLAGLSLPQGPLLVLLMPAAPEDPLRQQLGKLGIDLLIYEWCEDRAVFPALDALQKRILR